MPDNQLSVWLVDFPKEVLILLKSIRKLFKYLSRILISSQKEVLDHMEPEFAYRLCMATLSFIVPSNVTYMDISWVLTKLQSEVSLEASPGYFMSVMTPPSYATCSHLVQVNHAGDGLE